MFDLPNPHCFAHHVVFCWSEQVHTCHICSVEAGNTAALGLLSV